jgi:hypothetical protein
MWTNLVLCNIDLHALAFPAPCIVTSNWLVEESWTHLRAGYINVAHPVAKCPD